MKKLIIALVALAGCGGGGGPGGSGTSAGYGCDIPNSNPQSEVCEDYLFDDGVLSVSASAVTSAESGCKQGGGTVVTACDTKTATGGCRSTTTTTVDGITVTSVGTTWYYSPALADANAMMDCTNTASTSVGSNTTIKYTWVTPPSQ